MKQLFFCISAVLLLTASCDRNHKDTALLNEHAALPEFFRYIINNQNFIASTIGRKSGTLSLLYHSHDTLTLITWKKKSDENWFGANVPDSLLTVEVLQSPLTGSEQRGLYNCFNRDGRLLKQDAVTKSNRVSYIRSLKPSIIP